MCSQPYSRCELYRSCTGIYGRYRSGQTWSFYPNYFKARGCFRKGADQELAAKLHEEAHHECMIANSVNFPLHVKPALALLNNSYEIATDKSGGYKLK